MAKLNRAGVAAVFAADTELDVGTGFSSALHLHFYELAYARPVESGKRVAFKNLLFVIVGQELAGVVARETESHLRKVVCAEAEKLSRFCDFRSRDCRAGNLYHSAHEIIYFFAALLHDLLCRCIHDIFDKF